MSKRLSALEELAEMSRLSERRSGKPVRVLDERARVQRVRTVSALEELRDMLKDDCGGPLLLRMLRSSDIGLGNNLAEVLSHGDEEAQVVVNDLVRDLRATMAECVEKAANGLRKRSAKTS